MYALIELYYLLDVFADVERLKAAPRICQEISDTGRTGDGHLRLAAEGAQNT